MKSDLNSKRLDYIDVAKGIAILLVIVGHTFTVWKVKINWIFTFHMPLFFILSGFFFKSGKKTPWYKLFKSLIIPYLIINFIILFVDIAVNGITEKTCMKVLGIFYANAGAVNVKNCLVHVPIIGMTWFLLALFWCRVIYNELDKLSEKLGFSMTFATIILAFVSLELSKYVYLPFSLMPGITAMFFYHTGRLIRQKNIFDKKFREIPPVLVVLALILWIICWFNGHLRLNENRIKLLSDFAAAIIGTYFVVMAAKQILKIPAVGKFFKWCGKNSMAIFGFHALDSITLYELFKLMPSFNKIDSWGEYFAYLFVRLALNVVLAFVFTVVKNKLKSIMKNKPEKITPARA